MPTPTTQRWRRVPLPPQPPSGRYVFTVERPPLRGMHRGVLSASVGRFCRRLAAGRGCLPRDGGVSLERHHNGDASRPAAGTDAGDVSPRLLAELAAAGGLVFLAFAAVIATFEGAESAFGASGFAFALFFLGLPRFGPYYRALNLLDTRLLFSTSETFRGYGGTKVFFETTLLGSVLLFHLAAAAQWEIAILFGVASLICLIPWGGVWVAGLTAHGMFVISAERYQRRRRHA